MLEETAACQVTSSAGGDPPQDLAAVLSFKTPELDQRQQTDTRVEDRKHDRVIDNVTGWVSPRPKVHDWTLIMSTSARQVLFRESPTCRGIRSEDNREFRKVWNVRQTANHCVTPGGGGGGHCRTLHQEPVKAALTSTHNSHALSKSISTVTRKYLNFWLSFHSQTTDNNWIVFNSRPKWEVKHWSSGCSSLKLLPWLRSDRRTGSWSSSEDQSKWVCWSPDSSTSATSRPMFPSIHIHPELYLHIYFIGCRHGILLFMGNFTEENLSNWNHDHSLISDVRMSAASLHRCGLVSFSNPHRCNSLSNNWSLIKIHFFQHRADLSDSSAVKCQWGNTVMVRNLTF